MKIVFRVEDCIGVNEVTFESKEEIEVIEAGNFFYVRTKDPRKVLGSVSANRTITFQIMESV